MENSIQESGIISADQIRQIFFAFRDYITEVTDPHKADQLARESYQTILGYFRNLKKFSLDQDGILTVEGNQVNDHDLLAFSVWMQQYIREVQKIMIGLGEVRPEKIVKSLAAEIPDSPFFDYFREAAELVYE